MGEGQERAWGGGGGGIYNPLAPYTPFAHDWSQGAHGNPLCLPGKPGAKTPEVVIETEWGAMRSP